MSALDKFDCMKIFGKDLSEILKVVQVIPLLDALVGWVSYMACSPSAVLFIENCVSPPVIDIR